MGRIVDQVEAALARIAERDADIRSFIHVDRDRALAEAGRQSIGPLAGKTYAVKDNLARRGAAWTAGIAGRRNVVAEVDAHAVSQLQSAGAVLLGGLNMEEAALGATTDNPAFGRCMNPLMPGYTPGGSSGGSAAAVAAGFVEFSLGTDTMGSVRLPAAYCGIAGLKPTTGLIGRSGLLFLAPSLDAIGPMACRAADLWPVVQALAGADPEDPLSEDPPPGWEDADGASGIRIVIPEQISTVEIEPAIRTGLDLAVDALRDLGADVGGADLPHWSPGKARRAGLLIVEAEGADELADLMDQPGALSSHLVRLLAYGRDASPERVSEARAEIARAGDAALTALEQADFILMPTTPQRAFRHDDPVPSNQADLTALANFAGLPSVAIPVRLLGEALPASVQLIGPAWSEARLLSLAGVLQDRLDPA
ncbi:MAG: amidase [Pseudomonadota bacterium]